MQKKQLILQKITIFGAMALAILTLVYALGFSTDLYSLSYHSNPTSTLFYVEGAEIYAKAQPFNRELLKHSVIAFVICVSMFVTLTHRRRLYYVSNYITSLVFAGYAVFIALNIFSVASYYRVEYLKIDFDRLMKVTEMMRMPYVESTFMMDAGIALSVLLIIGAAFLILNLVLKTIWMSKEKWTDDIKTGSVRTSAGGAR